MWSFKWNNDLNGVVANNKFVAFTSDDGWVFVFDRNGHLLWKKNVSYDGNLSFSTADLNGDGYPDLFVGSCDDYLYALNGENGSLLWKFKTGDWIDSSPAIADIKSGRKLNKFYLKPSPPTAKRPVSDADKVFKELGDLSKEGQTILTKLVNNL